MMKNLTGLIFKALIVAAIILSCVEPYAPPGSADNTNFLVVDGFLNVGDSTAAITLKRSVTLGSFDNSPPEENATVTLSDEDDNLIGLVPKGNGLYTANAVAFNPEKQYIVNIRTADNRVYQSAAIELKQTPEIDSVTWTVEDNELKIKVNTHDPTGKSRYYRWEFEETYEYTAPLNSNFILTGGGDYETRPASESIHHCWKTEPNKRLHLGSSVRLTEDVISNHTIRTIQGGSILISFGYKLVVQQHSLTESAYRYWTNVQKSSESLGGLFDPLPSEIAGNVYEVSGSETVIGFISGGTKTKAKLFIDATVLRKLLPTFRHTYPCPVDTVGLESLHTVTYKDGLVNAVYSTGGFPVLIGFTASVPTCNDCRVFGGGTIIKPEDWNK